MRLFSILLLLIIGLLRIRLASSQNGGATENNKIQTGMFNQKLDHFSINSNNKLWSQKFQYFDLHFKGNGSPIFLIIGGEGELSIDKSTYSWIHELASSFGGLIIGLEHRFYGVSQPFGQNENTFSTRNLQFLSSMQALSDLKYFVENKLFKENFLGVVQHKNPVFTVGYSYPGALSVWARSKFPNIIDGAITASAVILSIFEFDQFNLDVYRSLQKIQSCGDQAFQVINMIQSQLITGDHSSKNLFQASELSDIDFLNFINVVISSNVQEGKRVSFCNSFIIGQTPTQTIQLLSQKFPFIKSFYDQFYNKINEVSFVDKTVSGRQWFWQSCTEFGWFQTGPSVNFAQSDQQLQGIRIDINYFLNKCKYAFGSDFNVSPVISANTNTQYGGINFTGTNIMILNGDDDPWKTASYNPLLSTNMNVVSEVINCSDCAHGAIINSSDPLSNQKKQQYSVIIGEWIAQILANNQNNQNLNSVAIDS